MKLRGGPRVLCAALICGCLLMAAPLHAAGGAHAVADAALMLAAGKLTLRTMPLEDLGPVNTAPPTRGSIAQPRPAATPARHARQSVQPETRQSAPVAQPRSGAQHAVRQRGGESEDRAGQASPAPSPEQSPAGGAAKGPIRLLGSVEFRGVLKNMPKWQRVVDAEKRRPTFEGDISSLMRPALYKQWQELSARVAKGTAMEKARAVNAFFNRWPYRTDREVWKVDDYWATPAEFLKRSGDCEDFAITKMYALLKLGVPADSMRIVALKDTIRNLAHAVLAVYIDGDAYILDNLTDLVLPHTRYSNYSPQYSVNGTHRWAHIVPKNKK